MFLPRNCIHALRMSQPCDNSDFDIFLSQGSIRVTNDNETVPEPVLVNTGIIVHNSPKNTIVTKKKKARKLSKKIELRTGPTRFFLNVRPCGTEITSKDVEESMIKCRQDESLSKEARRRELSRLAALRSRTLRMERLETEKRVIHQLQMQTRALILSQNSLIEHVRNMSHSISSLLSREALPSDAVQEIDEMLEEVADRMQKNHEISSNIAVSEAMAYTTQDLEGFRKEKCVD